MSDEHNDEAESSLLDDWTEAKDISCISKEEEEEGGDASITNNSDKDDEIQRTNSKKRQQDFVQQGNKLRRLIRFTLVRALHQAELTSHSPEGGDRNGTLDEDSSSSSTKPLPQDRRILWGSAGARALEEERFCDHALTLAQEKTQECAKFQRLYEEEQICSLSVQEQNKEFARKNEKLQQKVKLLKEALHIAGANAATARNDADSCRAREMLQNSDQASFQSLLEETKRACAQAKEEHEELHAVTRRLESRILQCESEKKAVDKQNLRLHEEKSTLQSSTIELEQTIRRMKTDLKESLENEENATRMHKEQKELYHLEKSQKIHLENELSQNNELIEKLTKTVTDQESLVNELKEIIEDLRSNHSKLAINLQDSEDENQKYKTQTRQQISKLELEKQELVLKDVSRGEDIQKLKLDNAAKEKQIEQLLVKTVIHPRSNAVDALHKSSNKIDQVEKTQNKEVNYTASAHGNSFPVEKTMEEDNTTTLLSHAADFVGQSSPFFAQKSNSTKASHKRNDLAGKDTQQQHLNNNIPPLRCHSSSKVEKNQLSTPDCNLCSKKAFGIMRLCQCGDICNKRAHMSCLLGRGTTFCGNSTVQK